MKHKISSLASSAPEDSESEVKERRVKPVKTLSRRPEQGPTVGAGVFRERVPFSLCPMTLGPQRPPGKTQKAQQPLSPRKMAVLLHWVTEQLRKRALDEIKRQPI